MTMRRHIIMVLALVFGLGGCAYLPPPGAFTASATQARYIEQWLDGGYYGYAIATIAQLPPEHPEYAKWRVALPEIQDRARAYERIKLRRGHEQSAAGDHYGALQTFQRGLEKLHQSEPLRQARDSALAQRNQHQQTAHLALLSEQARWLSTEGRLAANLAALDPRDASLAARVRQNQRARDRIAGQLGRLGGEALRTGDLATAERLFTLVIHVKPDSKLERNLAEVRAQQKARTANMQQDERRRYARERRGQSEAVAAAVEGALERGELTEARTQLRELRALEGAPQLVQVLHERLDAAVEQRVTQDLERGRMLYSRGAIEAALELWRPLQVLAPDHVELRANIERAERVQERLRQLRENDTLGRAGSVPPP